MKSFINEKTFYIKHVQAVHELSELKNAELNVKQDEDSLNHNNYFLEVGRNIDISFLVLCCHAMDLMFWDAGYD